MTWLYALWLLLPVAAASGWLAAQRSLANQAEHAQRRLSNQYLKGLNYLLNEQPDKAIDVFIRLIDVDNETFETHLALGMLFRRRGEMNRAIRIHQNLAQQKYLAPTQRNLAKLELGQDYLRAGLLDRAENLYHELSREHGYENVAYRNLLDIYQQEHDWEQAIQIAERWQRVSGEDCRSRIAQFHCEIAERLRRDGRDQDSARQLELALRTDPMCVRASLVEGELALARTDATAAMRAFKRVEMQDNRYLPEIIHPLQQCYLQTGGTDEFIEYLRHILDHYGGITPMLTLADLLREQRGEQEATAFIIEQLRSRPSVRGLDHFIDIALPDAQGAARENLKVLKEITMQLLRNNPVYRCQECGFQGKSLHWQCPSCKRWNTIQSIQGIGGE